MNLGATARLFPEDDLVPAALEPRTIRANERAVRTICRLAGASGDPDISPGDTAFTRSSREMARGLLGLLAASAPRASTASLSKELERLSKAIAQVVSAQDEAVLSEEEADAILNFMAAKFVERRFDDALRHVATPRVSRWFLLTHQRRGGIEGQ